MKKRINISRDDLKTYFIKQSEMIDSDKTLAPEIIEDEGYDPDELKSEGLSLIESLKKRTEPKEYFQISWDSIFSKIVKAGISKELIENKIIPSSLMQRLNGNKANEATLEVIDYLITVFGLNRRNLIESKSLTLSSIPSQLAYYKKPTNVNINQIKAYSHYAQFIAKTSSKACHNLPFKDYPSDIDEFKEMVIEKHGEISLNALLDTVWDLGICVIPLTDSGVFHGASWNIDGRHVIILKQKTHSHAKWIFDLLHELYHVFVHLNEDNTSVIEETELNPVDSNDSVEEREANAFANRFIFDSKSDSLVKKCVAKAGNRIESLKQAVIDVANENRIRTDFLANYVAFRLQHDGVNNWWGVANRLQIKEPAPNEIAKQYLAQKLDFKILNQIESNMLSMAIN